MKEKKKIDWKALAAKKAKGKEKEAGESRELWKEVNRLKEEVEALKRIVRRLAPNDPDLREIMRQENPDVKVLEMEGPITEPPVEMSPETPADVLNPAREGIQQLYISKKKPWKRKIGLSLEMKRALRDLEVSEYKGGSIRQGCIFSVIPKKILDNKPELAVELPPVESRRIVDIDDVEYVIWRGDTTFAMTLHVEGLRATEGVIVIRSDYSEIIRNFAMELAEDWPGPPTLEEVIERIGELDRKGAVEVPDGQVAEPLHEGPMDIPEPTEKIEDAGDLEQKPAEGCLDGPIDPLGGGFGGGFFG